VVAARGDCVDMSRYLQEQPQQPSGSLGSDPLPARPDKLPMLSRDADRDRKCRDSVREVQPGKQEEEALSNPCVNLQHKLRGIRVAAGGEDSANSAPEDAAALAYKRRSFADMYRL